MERKTVAGFLVVLFLAYLTIPNFGFEVQLDTFSLILLGVILLLYFSDELLVFVQSIRTVKFKGFEMTRIIEEFEQDIENIEDDEISLKEISIRLKGVRDGIEILNDWGHNDYGIKESIKYFDKLLERLNKKVENNN